MGVQISDIQISDRVFYPADTNLPAADQIGVEGIVLANQLIIDGARIQGVADIVKNFGPGAVVKPGLIAILRRLGTQGAKDIKDLIAPMSFEEKLNGLGAAAINGAAISNKTEFELLFQN